MRFRPRPLLSVFKAVALPTAPHCLPPRVAGPAGVKTVSFTPESPAPSIVPGTWPASNTVTCERQIHIGHAWEPTQGSKKENPQASTHPPLPQPSSTLSPRSFTNEVPPRLVVFLLPPVAGPADEHGVVLQTPEAPRLNQVGHAITQVGGDHHLAEAFHFLCLHQAPDGLGWRRGHQIRPASGLPGPAGPLTASLPPQSDLPEAQL